MRTAIISIHDVAPHTLPQVVELRAIVGALAGPVPIALLVVPRYHGDGEWCREAREWLRAAAARGDEIVLHGYEHQSPDGTDGAEFCRHTPRAAASARLAAALQCLADLGIETEGFIAPAYAHPAVLTHALCDRQLAWWATRTRLHAGPRTRRVPSIGLGASTAVRRTVTPALARAALQLVRPAPAVRLDLHPADLVHPGLRPAVGALITGLLAQERRAATHRDLIASAGAPPPTRHTSRRWAREAR